MPKYRDMFREMITEHEAEFAAFKLLHDKYKDDQMKFQNEYNTQGKKIVEIVREWESRLCGKMERGDKAVYSARLSEKFWDEVRAFFPLVDYVGVRFE
jgi:hypothetical protein